MKTRITIRSLVKELLENENLIVNYIELNNGGFDLSVRIDEEAVNTTTISPITTCPYCGSINALFMYGSGSSSTNKNEFSFHYRCNDCHKEFDVGSKEAEVINNDK